MESSSPVEAPRLPPDAIEFVRFCYRRRRVGWPELYDEMCAVASRGLYRGWRFAELAEHGIGFSLQETPGLARIAGQVALEEGDRRGRPFGRASVARPSVEPELAVGAPVEPDLGESHSHVEPIRTTPELGPTMPTAALAVGAH